MHHIRPWLLSALLFGACGGDSGMNGDMGPKSCQSDDDCAGEKENRACRERLCTNVCPEGMTYVAPGKFTRGCNASENSAMSPNNCPTYAQPAHEVTLSRGFCLSRTELSVAQYRACVVAGRCPKPPPDAAGGCPQAVLTYREQADMMSENLPMNCLLWPEAQAACGYQGGRLPTEAEWEKGARGSDERRYAWGEEAPMTCGKGVNWGASGDCQGKPWAVGSAQDGEQGASAAFAYDMAGNLWEWTADWFALAAYATCKDGCTDPTGPTDGVVRVRRGGSYRSVLPQELRAAYREFHLPEMARSDMIGVRCAKDL
jgi:formylglycine-generating enzyme required for sulfatase activity